MAISSGTGWDYTLAAGDSLKSDRETVILEWDDNENDPELG
jgi:hypothetical protein